jgi:single-stranded-DNA-specific exonuclease
LSLSPAEHDSCVPKKNIKDTGYAKKLGEDDAHLKLFVKQNNSEGIPAIGFGLETKWN